MVKTIVFALILSTFLIAGCLGPNMETRDLLFFFIETDDTAIFLWILLGCASVPTYWDPLYQAKTVAIDSYDIDRLDFVGRDLYKQTGRQTNP